MSINGSTASFLPFTINGLTDASFSNSNLGVATATALTVTSATPLRLARFDLDKNLVSASVDESEVAVLTSNVFDGTQTMKPGHTTNINNVFETTIIPNPPYDKSSFTTSGISGYTPPLGTLSGPVAGEYSISQTASDRSIMKLDGFIPEAGRKYVYTFTMRVIDAPEVYVSVEQGGVQRSNTIIQVGSDNETISDTFTFDPSGSTLVFKFYTGSLDPWTATWSSFSLGYYEANINAPLTISNLATNTISTETLSFPSTLVNAESWNVYTVSTMGNPSTLGGLITTNISTGSTMYFTGDVLGAPNFQFTTLGNAGKVVCTNGDSVMSTTINAGQLEYITGLTSQAGGVGQNNTWTGTNNFTTLTDVAALRITSSISNVDYSVSVNGTDFLEFTNLLSNQKVYTDGDSLWLPNRLFCNSTIYTNDIQMGNTIYFAYGTGQQWGTTINGSAEYEIQDDLGAMRLRLSKTTGLTVSTLNITQVPSATPSVALGLNGSGGVVSFAVPSAGGTVNTSTTTARFLPYLSTATTLTNSLLNQIDNDSMGFGYTAIPNYPLGAGGKNMYINGSIFAGALNSMFATFGRDTNTSNPANEITFTAGGAGVLLSQIKSHSGSSPFVDATWTYSNTNPAPLGANQGQVLLTAKNLTVSGIGNINGGSNFAVLNNYMQTGSLTIGDPTKNYGGGTTLWNSNTAGLMMECADNTEISVHDAGMRVASLMYYDGPANTIRMGRSMGWGVSDVVASNNLTANCLIINGGGTYQAGCIYSDGAWGMLYRAKVPGTQANFAWFNSVGTELMRINTVGQLLLTTPDGPGFVHTAGGVIVESYIGGGGGWFGTRTAHPLRFYANNSSARMTLNTAGDMTHTAGDSSYMKYGPNATWSANLVVGATPDKSGAATAQVITTNGNLHLDAGNSNAIFYGYYANARGTPNQHLFYGDDYQFAGVAQNYVNYAQVCVFVGNQMRRSQAMQRQVYFSNNVAWGGGVNMTYAFYNYNSNCSVHVFGKCSGFYSGAGMMQTTIRLYSQTSGAYTYFPLNSFVNVGNNHFTVPLNIMTSGLVQQSWYDIYVYSTSGWITDGNDQLSIFVQILPVDNF